MEKQFLPGPLRVLIFIIGISLLISVSVLEFFSFSVSTFWLCATPGDFFARKTLYSTRKKRNNDHFPPHLINIVVSDHLHPSKSPNSLALQYFIHPLNFF
jgi:hypothetical protein